MYPWLLKSYQFLQNSLAAGNLHHGIIFYGKTGVGKSRLVAQLCQALLCQKSSEIGCGQCKSCQLFLGQAHPDLYNIQPENQIGVDDIRTVAAKLNTSSHLRQAKILVINEAHKMTIAAANSLLKTLEEPTRDTYIFLLTDKLDKLLPTIKSRCHKQAISVAQKEPVQAWFAQEQLSIDPTLFDMYWQRPLFLQEMVTNTSETANASILLEINQDMSALLNNRLSVSEFTDKYLQHASLCIEWLQLKVNEKLKNDEESHHDSLWACHTHLTSAAQQLTFTGVNKSLILGGTVAHMLTAFTKL